MVEDANHQLEQELLTYVDNLLRTQDLGHGTQNKITGGPEPMTSIEEITDPRLVIAIEDPRVETEVVMQGSSLDLQEDPCSDITPGEATKVQDIIQAVQTNNDSEKVLEQDPKDDASVQPKESTNPYTGPTEEL